MKRLYGIVTPMVTPFNRDGQVDWKALADLTDYLLAGGVHALYPLGTTGEAAFMTVRERQEVAEAVYGKGSIEGLAATCTANNGVIGGALTTMLTLGLPGDSVTAILLGSLIMYGLQPGPLLFRDHADMAYVIIALMVLAYVAILIVGLGASRVLVRAFMVRKEVVWTAVLILSTVGSYAINNNPLDVWFMFFAGILGLVLRQYGYPLGPLVLALLLGSMAESNFRRALTAAGDAGAWVFVTRPISLILLILAALSLVAPIIQQRRKARQGGVTVQP